MFLKLNRQRLDIYGISRQFVLEYYKLTVKLPVEEKFGMITQIRRAALSVHLNTAEGASTIRKPKEKDIMRFKEDLLLKLMLLWI